MCAGTFATSAGVFAAFSNPLSCLLFFEDLADPREDDKVTHWLSEMIFLALYGFKRLPLDIACKRLGHFKVTLWQELEILLQAFELVN